MLIKEETLERIRNNDENLTALDLSFQSTKIVDIETLLTAWQNNTYLIELNVAGNSLGDENIMRLIEHTAFKSLILSGNKLGINSAKALAKLDNLTKLDISKNNLGNAGMNELVKNSQLKILNISSNQINNKGLQALENNSTLSELNLAENKISDFGMDFFVENECIETLEISRNNITSAGAVILAKNTKIKALNLSHNQIGTDGSIALSKNDKLIQLDISHNQIGIRGTRDFIQNKNIKTLNLAGNRINSLGCIDVLKNNSITDLNVSYNQIADEGLANIMENKSLKRLNISYNFLTFIGTEQLAKHGGIHWLDIGNNQIMDEGIKYLTNNKNIKWLNVTANLIGPNGMDEIVKNEALQTLILSSNLIGNEGAEKLAENKYLENLYLSYCNIGSEGAEKLLNKPGLDYLNLNYNNITANVREALNRTNKLNLQLLDEKPPEFVPENLNTAFLLSQDYYLIRSNDGIIQFFNPAFSRELGYYNDELLSQTAIKFIHPEDHDSYLQLNSLHTQKPLITYESRYLCKNGGSIYVRWISQFKNNRIYEVGTDITELKVEQQKVIKKERKTDRLTSEKKAVANHMQALTEFIAHLCHELRNPISGLAGSIDIVKDHIGNISKYYSESSQAIPEVIAQELVQITECIKSMEVCKDYQTEILDENLDIAKISENKVILINKAFDVKNAINKVCKMFNFKAQQKNIQIKLNVPDTDVFVVGDKSRFIRIITNLISNAIKFTDKGYVTVNLSSHIIEDKIQLEVDVSDTGIGLDKKEISLLFKHFSKTNVSVGGFYGGSGLGLLIAKGLAKLMGGDISVTSEKGLGSKFHCVLEFNNLNSKDLIEQDYLKVQILRPATPPSLTPLPRQSTVLIVEDNETNRKILNFMMKKEGFVCVLAVDGIEAVEKYINNDIDIILMDIIMPNLDGIEATKQIRAYEKENEFLPVPIIALTGNALEIDHQKALDAGMNEYITKPFKKENVIRKMYALLAFALNRIDTLIQNEAVPLLVQLKRKEKSPLAKSPMTIIPPLANLTSGLLLFEQPPVESVESPSSQSNIYNIKNDS